MPLPAPNRPTAQSPISSCRQKRRMLSLVHRQNRPSSGTLVAAYIWSSLHRVSLLVKLWRPYRKSLKASPPSSESRSLTRVGLAVWIDAKRPESFARASNLDALLKLLSSVRYAFSVSVPLGRIRRIILAKARSTVFQPRL